MIPIGPSFRGLLMRCHEPYQAAWLVQSQEETSLEANERQVQRTGSTCFGVGGAGTPADEGRMDIWKCSIVFGIYIYIYIFILDIIHIILNIFDKLLCISKEIWEECVKTFIKSLTDISNCATTINGRYVAVDRRIAWVCSAILVRCYDKNNAKSLFEEGKHLQRIKTGTVVTFHSAASSFWLQCILSG